MDIDRDAVLETFAAECGESFALVETSLVALETRPDDRGLIETVFRAMHTLKGNAHSLEFTHLSEFAHAVEDILAQLHNQRLLVTRDVITLLLASLDVWTEEERAALTSFAHGDLKNWRKIEVGEIHAVAST